MNWLYKYGGKVGAALTLLASILHMLALMKSPFVTPILALFTLLVMFVPAPAKPLPPPKG